jgi:hypothetical protein
LKTSGTRSTAAASNRQIADTRFLKDQLFASQQKIDGVHHFFDNAMIHTAVQQTPLDLGRPLRHYTGMLRHFCNLAYMLAAVWAACPRSASAADFPGMTSLLNGLPTAQAMGRDTYVQMVMAEARRQGVPPALADAVAVVESGYNALARGTSGEVGLMQILPSTAAQLGFSGSTSDLFVPSTNIHYGVAYLARAWAMSGGSVCRALMKYRAGWGQELFSPLSITYCARASAWMDGRGLSVEDIGEPSLPATAKADPYVIAVGPYLKAHQASYVGSFHVRPRFQQDQMSALEDRWKSHQRHF